MAEIRKFFGLSYLLTWVLLAPWFFLFNVVFQRSAPWWLWLWVPLAFIGNGDCPTTMYSTEIYRLRSQGGLSKLLWRRLEVIRQSQA